MNFSIKKLSMHNFRNWSNCTISHQSGSVVVCGPSGSGKTSIMEAISMLGPGKGLRCVHYADMVHRVVDGGLCSMGGDVDDSAARIYDRWSVAAHVSVGDDEYVLRVAYSGGHRTVVVDDKRVRTLGELQKSLDMLWLPPNFVHDFCRYPVYRVKFLDRIIGLFERVHVSNLRRYGFLAKSRLCALCNHTEETVLDVIETELAELWVEIADTRNRFVAMLNEYAGRREFARSIDVEMRCAAKLVLSISSNRSSVDRICHELFRRHRSTDFRYKRTTVGIWTYDFVICCGPVPIVSLSFGERSLIAFKLLCLVMKIKVMHEQKLPVLLIDDLLSRGLDQLCRRRIYSSIAGGGLADGAEMWMSDTEPGALPNFSGLEVFQCDALQRLAAVS